MNDLRHDPEAPDEADAAFAAAHQRIYGDEQWIDVPEGEKPWGRTVRTWVDDSGKRHVQTNVQRPVEQPTVQEHYMALFLDGEGRMHVRRPDGAIEPLQFTPTDSSKAIQWATAQPADHDCTPWTERTERRIAALEDAVNRIADRLQYLLIRLEGDGK